MKIREKLEQLIDDFQFKEGIFASPYEKQMKKACELGKVKFYDKENYSEHMELLFPNCKKPNVLDEEFVCSLPDYNFLGIPIKRLIQHDCSDGYCYSIILALSLCFEDFKIATAKLDNYAKYYQNHGHNTDFEHCYLVLPNDVVIDTTFGIVCKAEIYTKIFKPSSCRSISSEELRNCELYEYLQSLKSKTYADIFPQFENLNLAKAVDSDEYWGLFMDWQNKSLAYKNPANTHIEDFFAKHISRTSNPHCLWNWMLSIQYHAKQLPVEDDGGELEL